MKPRPPRPRWSALPPAVRAGIEEVLGGTVSDTADQTGGFTPGFAARLRLADGRRAFAKAIGPELSAIGPRLYRQEITVAGALPAGVPAPRLLGSYDEDWVALVFEDVEGRTPALPWVRAELERVLAAVTELAARLTPAPLAAPRLAEDATFTGWRTLAADPPGAFPAAEHDSWLRARLPELAELEGRWPDAVDGDALLHGDLRDDNTLLTPDGRVLFVDWPEARVGASFADLVFLLPSVALGGGPEPGRMAASHPLLRDLPVERLAPAVAGVAGYFVSRSLLPPPAGLPTVRRFQHDQGVHAVRWLRRLLD
jgi:Phosphotransferase enzyme family